MKGKPILAERCMAALIATNDVTQLATIPEQWWRANSIELFTFVRDFVVKHGTYPPCETIEEHTGFHVPSTADGPVSYLRDRLHDEFVHFTAKKAILKAQELLNASKPREAVAAIRASIDTLDGSAPEDDVELITFADLLKPQKAAPYLIHGILEQNTSVGLVGPYAAGKSLLVQEMAVCVSTGTPFHGRPVNKGLVVYLCGEGKTGLSYRLQALHLTRKIDLAPAPLAIHDKPVKLSTTAGVADARRYIKAAEKQFGTKLALVIVDTLSRYYDGEENSASDMNAFLRGVDELRGDATSVVVHHTGHGNKDRARGASAWDPALDTSLVIAKDAADDRLITLSCLKQKDGEPFAPMSFRITKAPTLSAREDTSPINSVVLELTTEVAAKPVSGKNQITLLDHLEKLADTETATSWTKPQLRKIGKSLGIKGPGISAAIDGLIKHEFLGESGGKYTLNSSKFTNDSKTGFESSGIECSKVQMPIGMNFEHSLEQHQSNHSCPVSSQDWALTL